MHLTDVDDVYTPSICITEGDPAATDGVFEKYAWLVWTASTEIEGHYSQ